jgi:hypothetical protein
MSTRYFVVCTATGAERRYPDVATEQEARDADARHEGFDDDAERQRLAPVALEVREGVVEDFAIGWPDAAAGWPR